MDKREEELVELTYGPWKLQLVYIAAKLGIADVLQGSPKSSEELARLVGANVNVLHRLLRGMVVIGLVNENSNGCFELTSMGEFLLSHHRDSLQRDFIIAGETFSVWDALFHAVRSGETPFDHAFGMGLYEYCSQNPKFAQNFNHTIDSATKRSVSLVLNTYNFSGFQCIVDVGGGGGKLLAKILLENPTVKGILFDLPQVIENASQLITESGLENRCTLISGSFFDSVPVGGDAYILQAVIHNWQDEKAIQILKNCRRVMSTKDKLLLIERIIPEDVAQAPAIIAGDIYMLTISGGKGRTVAEHQDILELGGFELLAIYPTKGEWSIMEATPIHNE